MVVKAHAAVFFVASGGGLADVVQQRRPAQHQVGAVVFEFDGLAQHGQRVLVDVLVLVVFVDGHLHGPDFGQHDLTHPGLHQQVDPGDRVGAQQQLVQLGGHPFGADPGQLRGHLLDRRPHPGATVNPSCETNRAARSIRSGSSPNDTDGAAGVSSTRALSAAKPPRGSRNSPGPADVMRTAIAFAVKSRRTKSSSRRSPNFTSGLRDTWS